MPHSRSHKKPRGERRSSRIVAQRTTKTHALHRRVRALQYQQQQVLELVRYYGCRTAAAHKQFALDRIARILTSTAGAYQQFVEETEEGEKALCASLIVRPGRWSSGTECTMPPPPEDVASTTAECDWFSSVSSPSAASSAASESGGSGDSSSSDSSDSSDSIEYIDSSSDSAELSDSSESIEYIDSSSNSDESSSSAEYIDSLESVESVDSADLMHSMDASIESISSVDDAPSAATGPPQMLPAREMRADDGESESSEDWDEGGNGPRAASATQLMMSLFGGV